MARNRVQFQKGYSLTQFMDECCFSHSLVEPPGDLTGLFR